MPLDKRYGNVVSSLSPLFIGDILPNLRGPMFGDVTTEQRASSFVRLSVVSNRFYSTPENSKPLCLAGPGASHCCEAASLSPAPILVRTGASKSFERRFRVRPQVSQILIPGGEKRVRAMPC